MLVSRVLPRLSRRSGFRVSGAVLTAAALLGTTTTTASAATMNDVRAVVTRVFTSADPARTAAALSGHDRALLLESFRKDLSARLTYSQTGRLSPAAARAAGLSPAAVAASGGCWYHYDYHDWYDLIVFHTGATWMQLNWCSNGSSITSYNVSNTGGAGYSGVSYDGVVNRFYNNVGWEVRAAVEYHFNLAWANAYPCSQVRGGRTGLYSTRYDCNLG